MKDDRILWDLSPALLRGAISSDLKFDAAGSLDDDVGDGISAVSLINNIGVVPGLWKVGYSRFREALVPALDLRIGENYFEFPYDWRRDNRGSARRLKRQASIWLKQWREVSGNDNAKICIVAHSMGGLVARYYIENLGGWKDVCSLITVGTPHRGSGKAVDFLNSRAKPLLRNKVFAGLDIFANFDSLYQLLPTYNFIATGDGWKKVHETALPGIDQDRAVLANAFHDEIEAAYLSNSQNDGYIRTAPTVKLIVGSDQPTLQSGTLSDGALHLGYKDFTDANYYGDETVPRVSAVPRGLTDSFATFVCNTHSALTSDSFVLQHIKDSLIGSTFNLDNYRAAAGPRVRLKVPSFGQSGEPVVIEAEAIPSEQKLTAVILRIDEPQHAKKLTLYRRDRANVGEILLSKGLYKVTITFEGIEVSDLFCVLDDA